MRARTSIVSALVAGVVVLALARVLAHGFDEPMSTFMRDFQVTAEVPWYTGSISVLNSMVWASIAALCLLVAWSNPSESRPLRVLGGLTLVFAADDALLLHDAIGPNLGIPEPAFLVVYAVVALWLLWVMVREASREVAGAFLVGAVLLGLSAVVDQSLSGQHFLEDGAKLLGALVWLTVPMIACRREVTIEERCGEPGNVDGREDVQ